jgi:hypothetical protein
MTSGVTKYNYAFVSADYRLAPQAELQSTPLNPLAEPVEWMDLNPRSPSV